MATLKEEQLLKIIEISSKFIDSTAQQLSNQIICDYMLELSGASYVEFYLYDYDKQNKKVVAVSGTKEKLEIHNIITSDISKDKVCLGKFILYIDSNKYYDNEDIIKIYTAHVALFVDNRRIIKEYERFFAVSTDLLCMLDMDGHFVNVNDTWRRQLGYTAKELKSQNYFDFVHPEDTKETMEIMEDLCLNKQVVSFINKYKYSDGSYRYIEWFAQAHDNIIYGSGRDITEKHEKQKEVEFLSFRDYLTGLYNRRYMEEALKSLNISRNLPLTLMVIDINGLKLTNDAFGHGVGDKLIKSVADIIKNSCRSDDVLGRVGGDEFLILLPNTDFAQAKKIKERMLNATEKANKEAENSLIISFSIGYAVKTMETQNIIDIEKTAEKNMYRYKAKHGKQMRNETIEIALGHVFSNDSIEQEHAERVSLFCEQIAEAMNLSDSKIFDAKIAGILHGIGKITVPMEIMNKPGKLSKKEWEEIKRHPVTSYNIIKSVDEYAHLAESVLYHHERPDGQGYPQGLKEEQIPLLSRIIAVADAYEAMIYKRNYKQARSKEEAIVELRKHAGTQFDSNIVEVFINKIINKEERYSEKDSL